MNKFKNQVLASMLKIEVLTNRVGMQASAIILGESFVNIRSFNKCLLNI